MKKPRWTDAELALVQARFPHEKTRDLAFKLGRSVGSVEQCALRLKLKKSAAFMASPASGRLAPGNTVHARHPVGAIITNGAAKGYLWIKLSECGPYPQGWRLLHHHVWESAHGPIPLDHVVAFRNGERTDCALENLELVSRHDWALRHAVSQLPSELISLIALRTHLTRAIRRREENELQPTTEREA